MNLANEISSLESEVESLRATNRALTQHNDLLDFENTQLRRALERANAERDHHMVKKAELKTLLDHTGASLVAGIQKFHEQTRQEQADAIQLEGPSPQFLTKQTLPEATL